MDSAVIHTQNGLTKLDAISFRDLAVTAISETLAKINRFAGRTPEPWSVASHSVLVSRLCPSNAAAAGLLHDAHEAFIGDLITPAVDFIASRSKPTGASIVRNCVTAAKQAIDRQIEDAWAVMFSAHHDVVEHADAVACHAEMFAFFGACPPVGLETEVERALTLFHSLPQGGDWRTAARVWAEEARRLAMTGDLQIPPEAASPLRHAPRRTR